GIGLLPGPLPQRDGGLFIFGAVGAKGILRGHRVPGEWCEGIARAERDPGPSGRIFIIIISGSRIVARERSLVRDTSPNVPSASARCGGCAGRLLRLGRYRAAGIRRNRRRPAAAPVRRARSDTAPPRSRAPTTIPSS